MIFFKKRSKKSAVKKAETVSSPPPPPLPTPKQQQAQKESCENWIQLDIPISDFSPFDMSLIYPEQQIEHTEVISITSNIDAVLDTSATKHVTELYTTYVDNENDIVLKEETPSLLSSIPCTVDIPKDVKFKPYAFLNVEKSDESENAGVSFLVYSEGEETRPVSDKIEFSPNRMMADTAQDIETCVQHLDINYSTEENEKDENENIKEESTDLAEEKTPFLGNNQLLLEQTNPITITEQTIYSPTLPPTILNEEDTAISKLNEDDSSSENIIEAKSKSTEQNSVEPPETVDSLEIASHQQESDLTLNHDFSLPQSVVKPPPSVELTEDNKTIHQNAVSTFENENGYSTKNSSVLCAYKKNNNKVDVIVKRKSGHSLIPRKQYASSVVEENPVVISPKLPVSHVAASEYSTNRRGSSGSFIPTFQQQNRLSLIISENSANYKNWNPSFDSPPKSPNSILSSASTSSSGSSGTTTTKEKRSSIKSYKLNMANTSQHSKIPVIAVALPQTGSYAPKSSPANISNFSRLPKRNSANL